MIPTTMVAMSVAVEFTTASLKRTYHDYVCLWLEMMVAYIRALGWEGVYGGAGVTTLTLGT